MFVHMIKNHQRCSEKHMYTGSPLGCIFSIWFFFWGEKIPRAASQESVLLAGKQWVAKISFLVLNRVSNLLNKPLQPRFISTFTSLKVCVSTKFYPWS